MLFSPPLGLSAFFPEELLPQLSVCSLLTHQDAVSNLNSSDLLQFGEIDGLKYLGSVTKNVKQMTRWNE